MDKVNSMNEARELVEKIISNCDKISIENNWNEKISSYHKIEMLKAALSCQLFLGSCETFYKE